MGEKKEDSKGEEKKEEEKKEEKKEEEEAAAEIVLKVDMHCQACARKVARALKGFEGVEDVSADSRTSKVVVKGKTADPMKVCERLQKKSGRKVELISPLPPPPDHKTEDNIKPDQPKEDNKDQPPAVITVKLKVSMHCEACAQALQKRIRKIKGVESVETDVGNHQVVVKGVVEPSKLVEYVYKRTGKQASIVKEEEKKEEEKKEETTKKDEKEDEKKDGEDQKREEEEDMKFEIRRSNYWTSKYEMEYYAYPTSQIFSDENPNACSVM